MQNNNTNKNKVNNTMNPINNINQINNQFNMNNMNNLMNQMNNINRETVDNNKKEPKFLTIKVKLEDGKEIHMQIKSNEKTEQVIN